MSGTGISATIVCAFTVSAFVASPTEVPVTRTSFTSPASIPASAVTPTRMSWYSPGAMAGDTQPAPVTAPVIAVPPLTASKYATVQPALDAPPVMRKVSAKLPAFLILNRYTAVTCVATVCVFVWFWPAAT